MTTDAAEPDLTPMLDVVFILLVFFIVTATFVKEAGIDVPSQNAKPNSVEPTESIVVEIRPQNRYYVNRRHTDKRALGNILSRLHAENPERSLVVVPDPESDSGSLVHVLDVSRLLNLVVSISVGSSST